jgi:hypothetical protein
MTAPTTLGIAPLAVRSLMPANYLKRIQQELGRRKSLRQYSDSVISEVVIKGRTTHAIWPVVLKIAQAEKARRDEEQQLNAAYLLQQEQA